jgi:PiT family inorganic phosphate transporter
MDTDAAAIHQLTAVGPSITQRLHQDAGNSAPATDADAAVTGFLKEEASKQGPVPFAALAQLNDSIDSRLRDIPSFDKLSSDDRRSLRKEIYLESEGLAKILKTQRVTDSETVKAYGGYQSRLSSLTKYIPVWVKLAVAIALGVGTTVGWKRIVVTVGEKIGKSHLTYAQGACAELVTMCTIEAADQFGLPASTTHVLSSGVAGAMFANRSGLQTKTLRNLLLAWVLTLPVCIFLGAGLFAAFLYIVIHYIP